MLGLLGQMSSRVVFALLDCLRSSHDAAVQFDSRPGLKFLVEKVSRFDVAANLYRQAGIARTVYAHVLLELSRTLDDLSVHNVRRLIAAADAADEKHDSTRRRSASADDAVCCVLMCSLRIIVGNFFISNTHTHTRLTALRPGLPG